MDQEINSQNGAAPTALWPVIWSVLVRSELSLEKRHFVHLSSHFRIWSWGLRNDQKDKIANTNSWDSEFHEPLGEAAECTPSDILSASNCPIELLDVILCLSCLAAYHLLIAKSGVKSEEVF